MTLCVRLPRGCPPRAARAASQRVRKCAPPSYVLSSPTPPRPHTAARSLFGDLLDSNFCALDYNTMPHNKKKTVAGKANYLMLGARTRAKGDDERLTRKIKGITKRL